MIGLEKAHPIPCPVATGPPFICSRCAAPWHIECNACAAEWDHECKIGTPKQEA